MTWVNTQKVWRIFWHRADMIWHRYAPLPEVKTLEEFIDAVEADEDACFYGEYLLASLKWTVFARITYLRLARPAFREQLVAPFWFATPIQKVTWSGWNGFNLFTQSSDYLVQTVISHAQFS